ncbi:MAG: response regulator, partial [Desulfobacteraceae bacterium]
QGRIAYISPVIERVLGYGVDELVGKTFLDYVFREDIERVKRDFDKALERSVPPKEYRFIGKSGEIKWCRVNSRLFSENSVNAGLHGVLVDITWSKRLEEQLQRSQKMEALGVMAGGVAHDLNNILSGIVSYPELLLMDLPQNSPFRKPLETIKASGQNASAVVQDLLALSQKGVYANELLNISALVEQCLDEPDVQSLFDRFPAIEVEISLDADLLNINGSSVQIVKSLQSLITNAVEAMPEGGRLKIAAYNQYVDQWVAAFDTIKEGEYAVLSVSDSGVGIRECDQTRIFEPFYSKKVLGRHGSGLGMAVVWGTIKDHGGYIDLVSRDGSGTRFDLYFPASRELVMSSERAFDTSDIFGNGEAILIVDDMPAQREIASHLLTRLGYRCKSVPSGEKAVEFLLEHTADLVVLDMIMAPGIDGYETFRRIKAVRPDQKAIIASGYSETERVKQTLALGAGGYIKKPYTISTIGKFIKKELNKN